MGYSSFLIRITVCFVLGIIIGIERQSRRKIAGVRTITLVSLGAFLFVSVSDLTSSNDITRIAAQVVSGMGFLGAGVIIRDGANVRGLNTAATLWCSAAIGTLSALGLMVEAVVGVSYILLSNILLRFISRKMMSKSMSKDKSNYILKLTCLEDKETMMKNLLVKELKNNHSSIKNFATSKIDGQLKIEIQLESASSLDNRIDSIINRMCVTDGVNAIEFNKVNNYIDDDDDYEVK